MAEANATKVAKTEAKQVNTMAAFARKVYCMAVVECTFDITGVKPINTQALRSRAFILFPDE